MTEARGSWGSKLGFILAASGSAIGLGNIVFFSSNAYKYGGGAFYVPYLVALFLIGIPVMILELGAGRFARRSMPNALYQHRRQAGRGRGLVRGSQREHHHHVLHRDPGLDPRDVGRLARRAVAGLAGRGLRSRGAASSPTP